MNTSVSSIKNAVYAVSAILAPESEPRVAVILALPCLYLGSLCSVSEDSFRFPE